MQALPISLVPSAPSPPVQRVALAPTWRPISLVPSAPSPLAPRVALAPTISLFPSAPSPPVQRVALAPTLPEPPASPAPTVAPLPPWRFWQDAVVPSRPRRLGAAPLRVVPRPPPPWPGA